MSQKARFQETLRRLEIFDEGLAEAGFRLNPGEGAALNAKTTALLQVAVSVEVLLSPHATKSRSKAIYRKLGASTRSQAVSQARAGARRKTKTSCSCRRV